MGRRGDKALQKLRGERPQVAMLTFWRNDAAKNLEWRARHLLSKSYSQLRWVWVVSDSHDATLSTLAAIADRDARVTVVAADSPFPRIEDDHADRLLHLGCCANAALDQVNAHDVYAMIHESDLRSPVDVVERFLGHAIEGRCPIAGWPVLRLGKDEVFYDIWAYRIRGEKFRNEAPYHSDFRPPPMGHGLPRAPFPVDSVGSCWMFHAADVRDGVRCETQACLDLCRGFREHGRTHWVDPLIRIEQPRELWVQWNL